MKFLVVGVILVFAVLMLWRNFKKSLKGECNCSNCDPKNKDMCQEAIKNRKKNNKE
jgi:predicted negative regulator of RcsB-dependent stress response